MARPRERTTGTSILVPRQTDVHRVKHSLGKYTRGTSEGISAGRHIMRDLKSETRFPEGLFRPVCEFQTKNLG